MIDARACIGSHDVLLVTLDTLRYDVAQELMLAGKTPGLARWFPAGWEERHTPATFTLPAHQAFFAGFLPTPVSPGRNERLFAARFPGSETTGTSTFVFDAPDIVTGLAGLGYHTACIGGVGFFNKRSPLGCVLPDLFAESHWDPELGVTASDSTRNQVALAERLIAGLPDERRLFLFLNVSAIHQPNHFYLRGDAGVNATDTLASHGAALRYVDRHLPRVFGAMARRAPVLAIVCSDHGTAYGEDGYRGHRIAHRVVWTVPYAERLLPEGAA
jgi:hypothetical protein